LRHYIAKPFKEGGQTAEGQWQAAQPRSRWQSDFLVRTPRMALRRRHTEPAEVAKPSYRLERIDPQSPRAGVRGREESMARAKPVPSLLSPLGGGLVRQGAASVRARCRADGGPERRPAAQQGAGSAQRRPRITRCTDRSAGGCADRHTLSTT